MVLFSYLLPPLPQFLPLPLPLPLWGWRLGGGRYWWLVPVLLILEILVVLVVMLSSITFTSASTFRIVDLKSSGTSVRVLLGAGPSEVLSSKSLLRFSLFDLSSSAMFLALSWASLAYFIASSANFCCSGADALCAHCSILQQISSALDLHDKLSLLW